MMTTEQTARLAALSTAYQQTQQYEQEHGVKADGVFKVQGAWMTKLEIVREIKQIMGAK